METKTSDVFYIEVPFPVCACGGVTILLGIQIQASCLHLNSWSTAKWMAQVTWGTVFVIDALCWWTMDLFEWRELCTYIYIYARACMCVWDTVEAWQTCPLSADGGMHNSIWRQFHAVSLPVSSLFLKTDKAWFSHWPFISYMSEPVTSTWMHHKLP